MKKVAPPPPGAQPTLPNGDYLRRAPPHRQPMSCVPGEDCAFDELLEGRMELQVVLPDRRAVHMTVDRRTPMMDLLVHVATSNKISPGGHTIKVLSEEQHSVLYKPNTPIGSLNVNTVYIVPKSSVDLPVKRMPKLANQPFEQTFRLQVNLPRNQRMVLRVSPRITLAELKRQICNDKELDHGSHHLVHPNQPDTLLDLNSTLDVYGCAEISLLSNSGLRESIHSLSTQLIPYPRAVEEEKKRKGILRLFSKKKKETQVESNTNGIGSRHVSPTRTATLNRDQPKVSTKRKPAPAPPVPCPPPVIQSSSSVSSRPESEVSVKTDELGSTVSHSRHSSDSSGYHEPSVFSDCSENKSPEASIVHSGHDTIFCKEIPEKPKDLSNLITVPSSSSASIMNAARKRKAPQPPAPALPEVETPEEQSPVEITAPPLIVAADGSHDSAAQDKDGELERDTRARESVDAEEAAAHDEEADNLRQESEALQYFETVLQESCDLVDSSSSPKLLEEPPLAAFYTMDVVPESQSESIDIQTCNVPPDIEYSEPTVPSCDSPVNLSNLAEATEATKSEEAIIPECEKAPSDSDYYADMSSTNTDTSDSPPVPLTKDILLRENSDTEIAQLKSALTESTITETNHESIADMDDATDIPLVPKDFCPSAQSDVVPSEISKSKRTIEQKTSVEIQSSENAVVGSPLTQKRLVNFAMGCYKNEVEDIYSETLQQVNSHNSIVNETQKGQHVSKTEFVTEAVIHEVPTQNGLPSPVEIVPFEERRLNDIRDLSVPDDVKSQVQQRCNELSGMHMLPLTGRSSSLYNLSPQMKTNPSKPLTMNLELSNSSESLKRTQSDQNLSQDVPMSDEKCDFIQEQKRLHEEYLKLQSQFISWQKQLLNNQTLLQTEHIVPQMSFPAFEQYKINLENLPVAFKEISENEEPIVDDMKTRSLPRRKSRPLSVKELRRSETPPAIQRKSKSEETIDPVPSYKQEKAVMSDSGISTEETSDQSNVPSDIVEETSDAPPVSKCQTLPRSTTKPISALGTTAITTTKTMTLNRQTRPKSQVVSVTIGSWQQRNNTAPDISSASVASSRSMFQSLQNIPRDRNTTTTNAPLQKSKGMQLDIEKSDESKHRSNDETPKVNGKSPLEETQIKIVNTTETKQTIPKASDKIASSKTVDSSKQRSKHETKSSGQQKTSQNKPSKPIVRLSSMKDEQHPPPALHVLKKWPLPEINETETLPKAPKEQSFWEEITASAKRPTGRIHEKVTRAEVDLRKHRSAKSDASKATKPKEVDDEPKVHVTKVNINISNKEKAETYSSRVQIKSNQQKPLAGSTVVSSNSSTFSEKRMPFESELKTVLSKRASLITSPDSDSPVEPTYVEAKDSKEDIKEIKTTAQNGNSPPPPPPPPISTMPAIPPAAPIPKSTQLLMGRRTTSSKVSKQPASHSKSAPSIAPREELMLEIRGFGGRQALRKIPSTQPGWHLRVYGSASAVNS